MSATSRQKFSQLNAVAVFFLAAFVSVGDSVSAPEVSSSVSEVILPVYFLSGDGAVVPTKAMPQDLKLEIGVIAGGTVGEVDKILKTATVNFRRETLLNLSELSSGLERNATVFRKRQYPDVALLPASVRFARLSTIPTSGHKGIPNVATVLWDLKTNGSLMAIYCDRPCRMPEQELPIESRFESPTRGLAWMLYKKVGEKVVVTITTNPRLAIVIAPPHALDKIFESKLPVSPLPLP